MGLWVVLGLWEDEDAEGDNVDDMVCVCRDEDANDDTTLEGVFGERMEPRLTARSA